MSHQDLIFAEATDKSSHLLEVTQWLLSDIVFCKKLHVNCTWTLQTLAMTALFWSWSPESTVNERFSCAQRLTGQLLDIARKPVAYQGFMEILARHTCYLREQLLTAFRAHMMTFDAQWKKFGYVLLGVDGTDISVPRTASNKKAFTSSGKGKHQSRQQFKKQTARQKKQKSCPRILMTTLFHIPLGLPWSWRLGSKSDNERGQLLSMLSELPRDAMLVGDAGFIGYKFLSAVLGSGAEVVVRVGSNVKLLKQLGRVKESNGIVHVWPDWAIKKEIAPLTFRLVVLNNGKHPVYLITSVLKTSKLSDQQVAQVYAMRWDIELYHRNLKQTMGHQKLLCRSSENAKIELQWIVLGYTAMMLYAVDETNQSGIDVQRLSVAKVLAAFRQTARDYRHPIEPGKTLNDKIACALKDTYQRKSKKQSHDYPSKRTHKKPGAPTITEATKQQKFIAKRIKKLSLTA